MSNPDVQEMKKEVNPLLANLDPGDPADGLLFTTVKLRVLKADGAVFHGTAFWFSPCLDAPPSGGPIALVTNKHVLAQAVEITLVLRNCRNVGGKTQPLLELYDVVLTDPLQYIIFHPSLDVAAIPAGVIVRESSRLGCYPFVNPVNAEWIMADETLSIELTAIESVVMIGYPVGLYDSKNNLPIVRTGSLATLPYVDFSANKDAIADIAVFPGSSGSPLFAFSGSVFRTKKNSKSEGKTHIGWRRVFLGMLWGGHVVDAAGQSSAAAIPGLETSSTAVTGRIHLGYYIRAKHLAFLDTELRPKS